ncbi:hypothetical protein BJ508DRAFT_335924 [Ascobolus immersus RN42]|uniref:Peptidase S33 tripeptidyl aminopeptidase-like C-terminal domain-containing protein n=1 Tax=Ascobolus immersus RN42 TaxID=1160509 RepID=A0A3N4HD04_ASCIM|nr:hypothetical protein BJ508DRAFT_335924 [Ascobolus immersus RN42]
MFLKMTSFFLIIWAVLVLQVFCQRDEKAGAGKFNTFFEDVPVSTADNLVYSNCPALPTAIQLDIFDSRQLARNVFQCLKIRLPRGDNGKFADIAVMVIAPKEVKETHPLYAGPLMLVAGGPGATGFKMVLQLQMYRFLRELAPYHSIVAVDPAGVHSSGPNTDCFANAWDSLINEIGESDRQTTVPDSEKAAEKLFNYWVTIGKKCTENLDPEDVRYLGAVQSAKDFRAISRAIRVSKGLSAEGLSFYARSWGGLVGMSLAQQFPQEIKHGLIESTKHIASSLSHTWYYRAQMVDYEESLEAFYFLCANGKTYDEGGCRLKDGKNKTPLKIKTRVEKILSDFKTKEKAGKKFFNSADRTRYTTFNQFTTLLYNALRSPQNHFVCLSEILWEMENSSTITPRVPSSCYNSWSQMHSWTGNTRLIEDIKLDKASRNERYFSPIEVQKGFGFDTEAKLLVNCGDCVWFGADRSAAGIQDVFSHAQNFNDLAARTHLGNWVSCVGYMGRSAEQLPAPLPVTETKSTMIFITNELDPTTPKAFTLESKQYFSNSVLITQESVGVGFLYIVSLPFTANDLPINLKHTVLSSIQDDAVKDCIIQPLKTYFRTGAAPRTDLICEAKRNPFGSPAPYRRQTARNNSPTAEEEQDDQESEEENDQVSEEEEDGIPLDREF